MTRTQRLGNRIICGLIVAVTFGLPVLLARVTPPRAPGAARRGTRARSPPETYAMTTTTPRPRRPRAPSRLPELTADDRRVREM